MQTIERIEKATRETRAAKLQAFNALACRVVDEEDVDAEEAAAVIEAAGKTSADLTAEVQRIQARRQLRHDLQVGLPAIMEQREAIGKKLSEADRAFEAAKKLHADTVVPLGQELESLKSQTPREGDLRRQLVAGCVDAALIAELARLQQAEVKVRERHKLLSAAKRGDPIPSEQANAHNILFPIRDVDAQIADAGRQIATLEKQNADVRLKMLEAD